MKQFEQQGRDFLADFLLGIFRKHLKISVKNTDIIIRLVGSSVRVLFHREGMVQINEAPLAKEA
ncbi:MAG: hypothetical protein R3Y63_02340 [Eubacteriales bacterium]